MPINAEYIRKKEFHVALKGYKQDEVDKFLDIVAFEIDKLIRKNIELQEDLDKVKYEGFEDENKMNKVIQDVLVSAHKIADEVKRKAQEEAESYVNSKKDEAQEKIEELLDKKQQLEVRVKYLYDTYEELKAKIKNSISSFDRFLSEEEIEIEPELKEYQVSPSQPDESRHEVELTQEESLIKDQEVIEEEPIEKWEEEEKETTEAEKGQELEEGFEDHKREKKGPDIADPDIISEFFSSDES